MVIASTSAITLSIVNSANQIVEAYKDTYQVEATIGMNRENLMRSFSKEKSSEEERINTFNQIEQVSIEDINKYGDSNYVKSYYYTYSLGVDAKNLTAASESFEKPNNENTPEAKNATGDNKEKVANKRLEDGDFTLIGYNSYAAMTEFIEGNYTISSGEVSSDFESDSCVINEELATLNDLSVGDTITIIDTDNSNLTYKLKITGIYTENSEDSNDMRNMFSNSANNIITNSKVIEKILAANNNLHANITPTFVLNSIDDIENFTNEVGEKGLSEYYAVETNLNEVENATKGITNVKTFANTFLIITLVIGGTVLLVVNMINIRERKYEIGVLRTIGMSKVKVIAQFVIELLIISFFGLLIGAGIGSLSSVNVANRLLEDEIANSSSQMENIKNNFGGNMGRPGQSGDTQTDGPGTPGTNEKFNGITSVEQIDNINAAIDLKVLLELLAIGLGLTIVSSLSACIAIARFSPLTILKERS